MECLIRFFFFFIDFESNKTIYTNEFNVVLVEHKIYLII